MTARPLCLCLMLAAVISGCSPAAFTADHMVMRLVPPTGFHWSQLPVTIDEPDRLSARIGPDSAELLEHNWQSTTIGLLSGAQADISLAVHRFGSKDDPGRLLAQNKYPDAEPLKIGQEAYRWQLRDARETIFFRRDRYFCQLTIDRDLEPPALLSLAEDLDKVLPRPWFVLW